MSLYAKYRPQDWDSVVGQDMIVTILRTSLKEGTTGHAYIFTGSRGTGKTTSARILAKALNCSQLNNGNPCHQCDHCRAFDAGNMMDVIEIDGASNTGVNDVRDIIEKSKFEPSMGTYKIYIIDEVHMLSDGAFNALLKTIEEPPAHVKFILATTEIHKVPETIQSRAHRFDFRKIHSQDIINRLKTVTEQEGIKAEPRALEIIANIARGGMRDALTLLEQYTLGNTLTAKYLESSLSLLDDALLQDIISILVAGDTDRLIALLPKLEQAHIQAQNFFDQMLYALRDKMREYLSKPEFHLYEAIFRVFRSAYASLRSIPNDFLLLEMTLMQAVNIHHGTTYTENHIPSVTSHTSQKKDTQEIHSQETPHIKTETPYVELTLPASTPSPTITSLDTTASATEPSPELSPTQKTTEFSYRKLLTELKADPIILAALKDASFSEKNQLLTLNFQSKWHFDKMNEARHQSRLSEMLTLLFGGSWTLALNHQAHSTQHPIIDDIF